MFDVPVLENLFVEHKCCVLIPTYNNDQTLADVIQSVQKFTNQILVVNDGSTDNTRDILSHFQDLRIFHHEKNQGKGMALQTGFREALAVGYEYAISIDSDGQHQAEDLKILLQASQNHPNAIVIGNRNMNVDNVPTKSNFGKKFSNFWFKIETGKELPDTQSGYRVYPLKPLANLHYFSTKFEFEIEVMVRAVWKGLDILSVPVQVYYAPPEERVTHFRPFQDFTRISILNTFLVPIALLWFHPLRFIKSISWKNFKLLMQNTFADPNESIEKKAIATGFGIFMGIIPVWGFQMILATTLAHFLKLNKAIVLIAANISIPPVIPILVFLSFYFGSFITGKMPTYEEFHSLEKASTHVFQYVSGSIIFASLAGLLVGGLTWFILKFIKK